MDVHLDHFTVPCRNKILHFAFRVPAQVDPC